MPLYPPAGIYPSKARIYIFEDFYTFVSANGAGSGQFFVAISGTGSSVTTGASDANHPGVVAINTGTTTTGKSAVSTDVSAFLFGGGTWTFECEVYIEDLSTAGEEYDLRIGFGDANTGDMTDGAYFEYDRNTRTNWSIVTADNGTRTRADSGVAVAADTWVTLKITVNAAGSSVAFFIDGTETTNSPSTSHIPTGAGRQFGLGAYIVKSAGSTSRSAYLDYITATNNLTTPRP